MRPLLPVLLSCLCLTIYPSTGDACLNGVIMEHDEVVRNVMLAEEAIQNGRNKKAHRLLAADHYMTHSASLLKRVRMLKAVAKLRTGKTKKAERVFRSLLKKDKDNPFLRTRLAEALHARKGDDAVEAWKIMDDLEERDLIPDAQGYAVLARLRQRANDNKGHKRALARCRVMAGKKEGSVC